LVVALQSNAMHQKSEASFKLIIHIASGKKLG